MTSSTRITPAPPPGGFGAGSTTWLASSTTCSRSRTYGPSRATRTPALTRCRLSPAASSARTSSRSPATSTTASPSSIAAVRASGLRTSTSPVGRSRVSSRSCRTSRPRSRTPTVVHICSISASRWLDRKIVVPAAFSASSSVRISLMPCGSSPFVGSSSTSSRGRRISAAPSPSRWRMPERVRADRPTVGRVEPDLLEHLVDAARDAAPAAARRARPRRAGPG